MSRVASTQSLILLAIASCFYLACASSPEYTPEAECENGDTRTIRCGLNSLGAQPQVCTDYQWVNDGACDSDSECISGTSRNIRCGLNGRSTILEACDREGAWQYEDKARYQHCQENDPDNLDACMCDDPDECKDGDTIDEIGCGEDGDGFQPGVCVKGEWQPQPDTQCAGENRCEEGEIEVNACGLNNHGTQQRVCTQGVWPENFEPCNDPDECTNGESEERPCNANNGNYMETRTCENGQWGAYGICEDRGSCQEGRTDVVVCGDDDSGRQRRVCVNNEWNYSAEPCQQTAQRVFAAPSGLLLALNAQGDAVVLGDNRMWQLATVLTPAPTHVLPTPSAAIVPHIANPRLFSASSKHACAVFTDGQLHCWGNNETGELGRPSGGQPFSMEPVHVAFPSTEGNAQVSAVSVGEGFSCALLETSNLYCWGDNRQKQLAALNEQYNEPQLILANVRMMSTGRAHVCAVLADGTQNVFCWGANQQRQASSSSAQVIAEPAVHAQLSRSPTRDNPPPSPRPQCTSDDEFDNVLDLHLAGDTSYVVRHVRWRYKIGLTCRNVIAGAALAYDRALIGVGNNDKGQIGSGASTIVQGTVIDFRREEEDAGRALRDGYQLYASANNLCVETSSPDPYSLRCIGDNSQKQLNGQAVDRWNALASIRPSIDPDNEGIKQFALGDGFLCALLQNSQRIRCRGSNEHGQLGDGTTNPRTTSDYVLHRIEGP